jgi:hypothetical protein
LSAHWDAMEQIGIRLERVVSAVIEAVLSFMLWLILDFVLVWTGEIVLFVVTLGSAGHASSLSGTTWKAIESRPSNLLPSLD